MPTDGDNKYVTIIINLFVEERERKGFGHGFADLLGVYLLINRSSVCVCV